MKAESIFRITATLCWPALLLHADYACAQINTVTAKIETKSSATSTSGGSSKNKPNPAEVVLWLTPVDRPAMAVQLPAKRLQIVQHDKSFEPHLLIVPVGSTVDFPNRDPFFHNVFSLFDGKRFDLGLYEAGSSNSVRFDRVGVSFLFCNIHPEMSAVVVALNTSYYAVSDRTGDISIPDVPDGKYELHVWSERSLPEELKSVTRTVVVSAGSRDLGVVIVPENSGFSLAHKNKYGQDYTPPPTQGYSRP